jgi:hypothetical protein
MLHQHVATARRFGKMRVHALWRFASATVLAATLAGVTEVSAQATSQQRIPVRKESGGDVVRRDSVARADSIANAARRDSIAMLQARNDSLMRAEQAYRDSVARAVQMIRDSLARIEAARLEALRADSIARADSIRAAEAAAAAATQQTSLIPASLQRRGFYFGIAGGWSAPTGDYADPFDDGWNITVPFGFQSVTSRFGFRGDISYDAHGGQTLGNVPPTTTPGTGDPVVTPYGDVPVNTVSNLAFSDGSIWSGNVALTLDLFQWGSQKTGSVYLLGGGGIHYFSSPEVVITPVASPSTPTTFEGESQTKFGLNGGGGIAFAIGRGSIFVESRYFTAYTDNSNSDWVPIIIGMKWF